MCAIEYEDDIEKMTSRIGKAMAMLRYLVEPLDCVSQLQETATTISVSSCGRDPVLDSSRARFRGGAIDDTSDVVKPDDVDAARAHAAHEHGLCSRGGLLKLLHSLFACFALCSNRS